MKIITRQNFSGMDTVKDPNAAGIIYPLIEPNNQLSVSSIVDHHDTKSTLCHTEVRLANRVGDVINYEECKSIAFVKCEELHITPNFIEKMTGEIDRVENNDYINTKMVKDPLTTSLKKLYADLSELEFTPSVDFVKPENVSVRKFEYPIIYSKTELFDYPNTNTANTKFPKVKDIIEFNRLSKLKKLKYLIHIANKYLGMDFTRLDFEGYEDEDLKVEYSQLLQMLKDTYENSNNGYRNNSTLWDFTF